MTPTTTPFGRRPATLAQIAAQAAIARAVDEAGRPGSNHPAAVNKWKLFRALTEAKGRLGLSDRSLGLMNALLSFHPETALSLPARKAGAISGAQEAAPGDAGSNDAGIEDADPSCDLIVFPSNRQLALRAHGMSEATLRRHLAALVEAGLVARRDSPNGKRYARKAVGEAGVEHAERFSDAFGFDLTPLVARAPEFEALAEAERRAARARHVLKERVTLLRRDAGKLIALGLDEGLQGDWEAFRARFLALMTPLRRIRGERALEALAADLAALRDEVAKHLESIVDVADLGGNAAQDARHQSNSKSQWPSDLEPASKEEGRGEGADEADEAGVGASAAQASPPPETKSYPLGMVMEACPDLHDYAPSGRVRGWRDLLDAAAAVRPMIGISPDAWREAQEALGAVEAHVAVATILQRSIHSSEAESAPDDRPGATPGRTTILVNGSPAILSPGGYLRALTEKAKAGEFALGPVLMALIGQRLKAKRGRAG